MGATTDYSNLPVDTLLAMLNLGNLKSASAASDGWKAIAADVEKLTTGVPGVLSYEKVQNQLLAGWKPSPAQVAYTQQGSAVSGYAYNVINAAHSAAVTGDHEAQPSMQSAAQAVEYTLSYAQTQARSLHDILASRSQVDSAIASAKDLLSRYEQWNQGQPAELAYSNAAYFTDRSAKQIPPWKLTRDWSLKMDFWTGTLTATSKDLGTVVADVRTLNTPDLYKMVNETVRQRALAAVNEVARTYRDVIPKLLPQAPDTASLPTSITPAQPASLQQLPGTGVGSVDLGGLGGAGIGAGTIPGTGLGSNSLGSLLPTGSTIGSGGLTGAGSAPGLGLNGLTPTSTGTGTNGTGLSGTGLNGTGLNGPGLTGTGSTSPGLTGSSQLPGVTPGSTTGLGSGSPTTSLAGFNPGSTAGTGLVTPTASSGLGSFSPGVGSTGLTSPGLGSTGLGLPGSGSTGLASAGPGGLGAGTSGGTTLSGMPGNSTGAGNAANEAALAAQQQRSGSGMYPPPMYPPTGAGGGQERGRGVYLPEDVWTEGLVAPPAVISAISGGGG